jgi:signal transduction histidine kinase/ligand-binding sensor domain-containing protein
VLVWCPFAFALNTALDVSQYVHTAWKLRDGFTKGTIRAIAQTHDGYLWLGTEFGLLRFDGVRTTPWQPPADQGLPSNFVLALLTARDGTLWIGTDQGLASWKGGRVAGYQALAKSWIAKIFEARDGSIWITRFVNEFSLCAIRNGVVTCYGADGGAGHGAMGLYEDRAGRLWVGTRTGLWQWQPNQPTFYPLTPIEDNGIQGFAETEDGSLLISRTGGITRFVDGDATSAHPFASSMQSVQGRTMLRDRHGGLWIGTSTHGLVHVHEGITDLFSRADGLSGDGVIQVFEDREGTIWVATDEGLDRFRESTVVSYSEQQGLSMSRVSSVLASTDGSIWVGTFDGLTKWTSVGATVYRERGTRRVVVRAPSSRTIREITIAGTSPGLQSLFQDSRGRIWLSTNSGVGYLENDRFVAVDGLPGGVTRAIVEDRNETLWVANQTDGLFRLTRGALRFEPVSWTALKRQNPVTAMAVDPSGHGLWFGFFQGGVSHVVDGQLRASYAAAHGLAEGRIGGLYFDRLGALWAVTDKGVTRLKDGRLTTLTSRNGLPCDGAGWVIEDDARALWLGMSCGLVRIDQTMIDAWSAAVDNADPMAAAARLATTVFDHADGVRTYARASHYTAPVSRAPDGKLWFVSQNGLSVVDPRHLSGNAAPAPVHIESVIADRATYAQPTQAGARLHLPPRTRDLQIDYTALSLVAPEKVRFRYKLEGHDADWQDAGTRRQAFYNDLRPGHYRFRVTATNNSEVWNEAGAFLDFSVSPAYYQTTWFRVLIAGAVLMLLTAMVQLRARHMLRQHNMRFDERIAERTRIARDLHDTLLQSFQGVLLKFKATTFLLPDRPEAARESLDRIIEQASQAIAEGRDAVQGLRSSVSARSDLGRALTTVGEGLRADHAGADAPNFRAYVEGKPRDLTGLVADEVYRIAVEALRNAFRHAHASSIEFELQYGDRELRLRVRDDGCGIERKVLDTGRAGHYGLRGMHERASVVRGKLAVWSKLESGTEVQLTVPASIAYAPSTSAPSATASGHQT